MPEYDILFQDVFEIIATGIFAVEVEALGDEGLESPTFRFLAANTAYTKLLSLPVATLTGLSPYECFPPNIAQQVCVNYRRCLETRQPITYEESFEFETHRCTLLTTLSPKLEPDGRILRIIGSSQDISERKQKEEEQKQAEADLLKDKELLFTLIENVPIGIISTNEQGKILFVNPAFENICGYSAQELVGQVLPYPYWDLADLEVINNEFNLAMSGEKEHIELRVTRKNGERFLARLQPITIFDEQGNMLRHLATMEDITKYKQAEEELCKALETERELNEFKSRFVAMVSHEYRNPLATILSSAELLERYNLQLTEKQKLQHYQRIQTTANLLTQLVTDVLAISKMEARKQKFNPSVLNLEKFCCEMVDDLQMTLDSQHTLAFTCAVQDSTSLASAYLDKKLLRYIIGNLLSNAIKYSPEGSTIQFNLSSDQNQAILRIQDQGIGIPLKDQKNLFESFHRCSNVGSIPRTGLGMAIVKNAVDLHGGKITVESKVGGGTTFTVSLPLNSRFTSDEQGSAIQT